ncbi:hypothetical protein CDL12_08430 [Handroanthus impetiginosus]|uniref:Uncharacterized protein n=1 Tax=Handroanthus impetiginosus TaxID=429701 RepID=A0A2G9HMZ4_9LAMI|nr:hypothetical protein CDL12_08430 [Handroanthus impetiginosus]
MISTTSESGGIVNPAPKYAVNTVKWPPGGLEARARGEGSTYLQLTGKRTRRDITLNSSTVYCIGPMLSTTLPSCRSHHPTLLPYPRHSLSPQIRRPRLDPASNLQPPAGFAPDAIRHNGEFAQKSAKSPSECPPQLHLLAKPRRRQTPPGPTRSRPLHLEQTQSRPQPREAQRPRGRGAGPTLDRLRLARPPHANFGLASCPPRPADGELGRPRARRPKLNFGRPRGPRSPHANSGSTPVGTGSSCTSSPSADSQSPAEPAAAKPSTASLYSPAPCSSYPNSIQKPTHTSTEIFTK